MHKWIFGAILLTIVITGLVIWLMRGEEKEEIETPAVSTFNVETSNKILLTKLEEQVIAETLEVSELQNVAALLSFRLSGVPDGTGFGPLDKDEKALLRQSLIKFIEDPPQITDTIEDGLDFGQTTPEEAAWVEVLELFSFVGRNEDVDLIEAKMAVPTNSNLVKNRLLEAKEAIQKEN